MNDSAAKAVKSAESPFVVHNPETRPFWDAAAKGRFVVPRCAACGRAHWYPRAVCPFCTSSAIDWQPSPGRGVIHTFSVMRRAATPYAIAYVTIEEGPTMLTNIVDCDFDALAIGQPVKVVFRATGDGLSVPMFAPA